MDEATARATCKAINRYLRRSHAFDGGRTFGVDYVTFRATFPHISRVFNDAAEALTGRPGRYIPRGAF